MKLLIISILIFPTVWAQDLVTIKSDKVSYEIKLAIEHLNQKGWSEESIGLIRSLNQDLKKLSKANALFFLKSEFYRGILQSPSLEQKNKIQINSKLIQSLEEKLKNNNEVYTQMSRWLINSALMQLKPYQEDKLIDRYETINSENQTLYSKVFELQKMLNYLGPWLTEISLLTPSQFNQLMGQSIKGCLQLMTNKSHLFNLQSNKLKHDGEDDLFEISLSTKEMPSKGQDITEQEPSAQDIIKKIEVEDLSSVSEKIDAVTEPINQWIPKE